MTLLEGMKEGEDMVARSESREEKSREAKKGSRVINLFATKKALPAHTTLVTLSSFLKVLALSTLSVTPRTQRTQRTQRTPRTPRTQRTPRSPRTPRTQRTPGSDGLYSHNVSHSEPILLPSSPSSPPSFSRSFRLSFTGKALLARASSSSTKRSLNYKHCTPHCFHHLIPTRQWSTRPSCTQVQAKSMSASKRSHLVTNRVSVLARTVSHDCGPRSGQHTPQ
ncbi:MAG: hypothetical protein J3Q66DRAFT_84670 [Benniella sp.]|nr:MAG: hypothetical protein J3Q66DRAFT_84670 [Benniella sp.]